MPLSTPTNTNFEGRRVREFLIDWGLMNEGARGRLTQHQKNAMRVAVEVGVKFIDWDIETQSIIKTPSARKIPKGQCADEIKPFVERGANQIHITSKDGSTTVIDHHPRCGKPLRFCTCKVVDVPEYYNAEKVLLVQA